MQNQTKPALSSVEPATQPNHRELLLHVWKRGLAHTNNLYTFLAIFPSLHEQKRPISTLYDAEVEYTEQLKRPTAQSTEKNLIPD